MFKLLQINPNWCLPISSGALKYGPWEQAALVLFFLFTGYLFFKQIKSNSSLAEVSSKRIDLLKNRTVYRFVKWKYFSFSIRLISGLLFVIVIITGLYGRKFTSLAAGFTWVFWWTLLIFFVAFAGKIFCAICPWDFFANLVQFNWFFRVKKKTQGLNLKWPKYLANVYPAVGMFVLLTWLELGFDITRDSYLTAILGLLMLGMAVLTALIFEKRSFCRYACLVGRVSGMYAQVSPIELRKIDNDVCLSCKTKECITGTDISTPCPTFEKPFLLKESTYCTLCTECVRSCQKDNLTISARPLGADLGNVSTSKKDESILAYVLMILTFFHGITMTKYWFNWTSSISEVLHTNYLGSFTVLMVLLLLGGYLVLRLIEVVIGKFVEGGVLGINLAYVFIPITLGYHLGHNSMHLFVETAYLVPVINDPMGYGWDLFNLSQYVPKPFIGPDALRYIQLFVVSIGFFYSVKTLRSRVEKITEVKKSRIVMYLGYYSLLLAIGILSIWFIYQPMIMKSAGV